MNRVYGDLIFIIFLLIEFLVVLYSVYILLLRFGDTIGCDE